MGWFSKLVTQVILSGLPLEIFLPPLRKVLHLYCLMAGARVGFVFSLLSEAHGLHLTLGLLKLSNVKCSSMHSGDPISIGIPALLLLTCGPGLGSKL